MGRVFFGTRKNVHAIDADYTILDSDSGKVFMLSATAGTVAVTLPVAANLVEGAFYKFIVLEDTPANVITIAAGSAIIDLVQKDLGGDAANSTAGTAVSNIVIGTATKQGDIVNVFTDGTTYYAECLSSTNNSITTS